MNDIDLNCIDLEINQSKNVYFLLLIQGKMNNLLIFIAKSFLISFLCFMSNSGSQAVNFKSFNKDLNDGYRKLPTEDKNELTKNGTKILIALRIKDNSYSLPTFLATLETIKCPSESGKCDLWYELAF